MTDEQQTQPEHRWWQTLPGILGAAATVITAITGLVVALKPSDTATQPAQNPAQQSVETPKLQPSPAEAKTTDLSNEKLEKASKKKKKNN